MDNQAGNSPPDPQIDGLLTTISQLNDVENQMVENLTHLKSQLKDCGRFVAEQNKELGPAGKKNYEAVHDFLVEKHNKTEACLKLEKYIRRAQEVDQALTQISEHVLQGRSWQKGINANLQNLEMVINHKESERKAHMAKNVEEIDKLKRDEEQAQFLFEQEMQMLDEEIAALNNNESKNEEDMKIDDENRLLEERIRQIEQETADLAVKNERLKHQITVNQEINEINSLIDQQLAQNKKLLDQIEVLKQFDGKKLIDEEKSRIVTLTKESLADNMDVAALLAEIKELQSNISAMVPIDLENSDSVRQETAKLKEIILENEETHSSKKNQYTKQIEDEISLAGNETEEKIARIEEQIAKIESQISLDQQEKANLERDYQGKLLECDVFKKKVKIANEERDNLVAALKPSSPKASKRRVTDKNSDDEDSEDSTYKALDSFPEMIKYKRKKRKEAQNKRFVSQSNAQQDK